MSALFYEMLGPTDRWLRCFGIVGKLGSKIGKLMNPAHANQPRLSAGVFRFLLVSGALALIVGLTWLAARHADRELRDDLLLQARMVATAVNTQPVAALSGTATDLVSSDYQRIKEQLTVTRLSNPDCRFLYLISRRSDGTIIFHVDSEPADSKDYSPPGQTYDEAPGELHDVFATGRAAVRGPYDDRWGTWVSAFVPLPGRTEGKVQMVFGMDISAADWIWTVALRSVPLVALVVTAVMLGLLASLLYRSHRNIRANQDVLRESEEKYRVLVETAGEAIFIAQNGMIRFCNKSFSDISGYELADLANMAFSDLVHPDDRQMVYDRYIQRLEGKDVPSRYRFRFLGAGGNTRWADMSVALISWEGKPASLCLAADITELNQAEEALKKSEGKYRYLFERALEGILVARGDTLEFVNPSLEGILGYPLEKITSGPFINFIHPDDQAMVVDHHLRRMRGEPVGTGYDFRIIDSGGAVKWLTISSQVIEWEGAPANLSFIADITKRKRVEEALKKSERNLSDIIEFLPDATFVIDLEGTVIAWNRAIEEMTGIPKEKMLGQKDHAYTIPFYGERRRQLLDLIDESDQELESKYKTIQRKGSALYAEAFAPALYGGKGAHFWATGAPLFDDSGSRVGAIESIRDITERVQMEEEKRSLEERLNRAEKMEALGILAGGVAHDLNNVLGVIVGYAELLMMKADESSSIRPQLVNIMNGGLKAAAIVDDLLTLARRGVSDRDVLNLNKIIADCQMSPEFEKLYSCHPSVKIRADIDPDLPNISGSSVHLCKSIYNLISNASEAMTKGGIVTIKTTNQYLDKPIQGYDQIREGDYVVLSVSDTGEGISTSDLKRIFEPFYTKKVMGRSGTGLGLAVVWGTVRDHHGYINVESEEGKGSTFTLYFPVAKEDITSKAVAVPVSEYMGNGESILVVDDVKEQRDLAAGMLGMLNYNVASVSSGEEAVAYLKEHEVDLMVLDMIMDPGMDGLDTYKQVLQIHPKQKAIIVSGFSESDRVRAAKGLGAGAYVKKPYIKEKLGLAVRRELD
jgi:two-component system, cell cycle sensor histidine kinase and response regulator CckA